MFGVSSLMGLFQPGGLYLICYAWLFGMSLWITFFGGVIAYKTLPRQHFSDLQHRVFPIYFALSIVLSSALLVLWGLSHPKLRTRFWTACDEDVIQAYVLASVVLMQSTNYFVIGPLTSRTMFKRQRLEKEEGKQYNEPGVSVEMKALTSRFGMLHGLCSLANLWAVIALGWHGLWIGSNGVKIVL